MTNETDVTTPRNVALYELGLAQGSALRHLEQAHRLARLLGMADTVTEAIEEAERQTLSSAEAVREEINNGA